MTAMLKIHLKNVNDSVYAYKSTYKFQFNKEKLQKLSREYFKNVAIQEKIDIVLSGFVSDNNQIYECCQVAHNGAMKEVSCLPSDLEEADTRIIPHINHIVQKSKKRAVVLSNDTDVFALLLHYVHRFIDMGLAEMWIRYGTGENIRFIHIHLLYEILGSCMSSAVMKAHVCLNRMRCY